MARFACPECGGHVLAEERYRGLLVTCPHCQRQVRLLEIGMAVGAETSASQQGTEFQQVPSSILKWLKAWLLVRRFELKWLKAWLLAQRLEGLIRQLDTWEQDKRREAIKSLSRLRDQSVVDHLIKALGNKFEDVRGSAAEALGRLGDARAVEPLIKALGNKFEDVRGPAAEALGRLGDARAVEPLIEMLGSEEGAVRLLTADALGKLGETKWLEIVKGDAADLARLGACGDRRAVKPLTKALGYKKCLDGPCAAAQALGTLGDPSAVEPLIMALGDKEYSVSRPLYENRSSHFPAPVTLHVRCAVAEALEKLRDARAVEPLIKALKEGGDGLQLAAAQALGTLGDPRALKPLIMALVDQNEEVRRAAAKALGVLGDVTAVEPLIEVLGSEEVSVRLMAADALGKLGETKWPLIVKGDAADFTRLGACGDSRAVRPLNKALGVKDWEVMRAAAKALVTLGDGTAKEPFVKALDALRNVNREVRRAAAELLGELGDARAVEPLIKALGDGSENCQWAAAEALGKLGDVRAVEPLIKALGAKDTYVPGTVVWALGELGDRRAVEPLIAALWDDGGGVAEALGKLGETKWLGIMEGHSWRRDTCMANLEWLGACGDKRAVEPLIAALTGGTNGNHHPNAAKALGELGDARAVEPLIEALGNDRWYATVAAAAEALGKLGDRRAVAPLLKAMDRALRSEGWDYRIGEPVQQALIKLDENM